MVGEKKVSKKVAAKAVKPVEKLGIKELMEAMNMINVFSVAAAKMAKDKKVSFDDISHLVDLAKEYDTIKMGIEDIEKAFAEIKDIDEAESMVILAKIFSNVKAIKAALK